MLDPTYTVTFNNPCTAKFTVTQVSNTQYSGTNADGTALLELSKGLWIATIRPSNPADPCYELRRFRQDTPNASDPIGSYENGDADVSAS
jgi:hypothetical protein